MEHVLSFKLKKLRRLLRTPLFSAVAVLTLGGWHRRQRRPVQRRLRRPAQAVAVRRTRAAGRRLAHGAGDERRSWMNQGPAFYLTYRDENRTFEDFGLWADRGASVTGAGDPERVQTLTVTDGALQALRARAEVGRVVQSRGRHAGQPGAHRPHLWLLAAKVQRRSRVVGRSVHRRRAAAGSDRRAAAIVPVPADRTRPS